MKSINTNRFLVAILGCSAAIVSIFVFCVSGAPVQAANYGIPELGSSSVTYGIPDVTGQNVEAVAAPEPKYVVSPSPTSLQVEWYSDVRYMTSGVSQTSYTLQVFEKKSGVLVTSVTTLAQSAVIDELDENMGYTIRLVAERDGVLSDVVELVGRTIPPVPRLLVAMSDEYQVRHDIFSNEPIGRGDADGGKYVAQLDWRKPAGKIRYYTVNIYDASGERVVKTLRRVRRSAVEVGGLRAGERYQYTVIAHFNDDYASVESRQKGFVFGE
ncbi:MAG: fibronectin type III domain-containing protein [Candidatus Kerfeldbacteria bacterium]|nr:fibronectin type III domain-containing protein [Candidatus Kerfeldbacteria bacterium]